MVVISAVIMANLLVHPDTPHPFIGVFFAILTLSVALAEKRPKPTSKK